METTSTPVEAPVEKVPSNLSKAELVTLMMDVIDSIMSECQKKEIKFQRVLGAAQSRWSAVHGTDSSSCGVVYKKMDKSVSEIADA